MEDKQCNSTDFWLGSLLGAILGFFGGWLVRGPKKNLRIHGVGTDPIMLNMVKDDVGQNLLQEGGAVAVYFQPVLPSGTPTVHVELEATTSSANPVTKFEALPRQADPVTDPGRRCVNAIIRLKAGERLTEETTVRALVMVKVGNITERAEPVKIKFAKSPPIPPPAP